MFHLFQCKNCGRWGVKQVFAKLINAKFMCKFCGKRFSIKNKSQPGLNLNHEGPYELGWQAARKCQNLNGKRKKEFKIA